MAFVKVVQSNGSVSYFVDEHNSTRLERLISVGGKIETNEKNEPVMYTEAQLRKVLPQRNGKTLKDFLK